MAEKPPPIQRITQNDIRDRFNKGHYLERAAAGDLKAQVRRDHHPAPEGSGQPYCTRSQLVSYIDATGEEIARVHQYLLPSGDIGASGKPDPKRLKEGGILFRIIKGEK